jgi:5'-nucleotidase
MPVTFEGKLVVAISSRALFDLDESHKVYEEQGVRAYADYQVAHENEILGPGVAFNLVQKLLNINNAVTDPLIEIVLISRNTADTGLRIFNSIQHYGLDITRAAFSGGGSPDTYIPAFGAHLFLSTHYEDVQKTLQAGYAAATILPHTLSSSTHEQLRIAFDGDSVLFSDEAERVYQAEGIDAFIASESANAEKPLEGGPLKPFLRALHAILQHFPDDETSPIRTALVTARSAPSHKRVINTLRHWNVRLDEAIFLGGLAKGEFLKAFKADFFFDDQRAHCESATQNDIPSGHVPHGVANS